MEADETEGAAGVLKRGGERRDVKLAQVALGQRGLGGREQIYYATLSSVPTEPRPTCGTLHDTTGHDPTAPELTGRSVPPPAHCAVRLMYHSWGLSAETFTLPPHHLVLCGYNSFHVEWSDIYTREVGTSPLDRDSLPTRDKSSHFLFLHTWFFSLSWFSQTRTQILLISLWGGKINGSRRSVHSCWFKTYKMLP